MKASVIIVTYNGMKWIEKSIESLLLNTVKTSIIIVDGNSSDATVPFIKNKYANDVTLIELQENVGFGKANNIGIRQALNNGSDYFFLINQDVYVSKDTFQQLIEAHTKEPHFGILSPIHLNGKGDAFDFNFLNYISEVKCKGLHSDIFLNQIKKTAYPVAFVNAAAWFVSKECLLKVGGFSPSFFHYGEDDNYIQRALFHGFAIGIVPTTVIFHDREDRSDNIYFKNKAIVYERSLISKGSDPNRNFSFASEHKKLLKSLLKAILTANAKLAKEQFSKLKILKKIDKKKVIENRTISKMPQTNFLE